MSDRKKTIKEKTLKLIEEHPGLNGVELKNLYLPSTQVFSELAKENLIEYLNGWRIKK